MIEPFREPGVVGAKGIYCTHQSSVIARFVQLEYEDRYRFMAAHDDIDFIDTYSACKAALRTYADNLGAARSKKETTEEKKARKAAVKAAKQVCISSPFYFFFKSLSPVLCFVTEWT